MVYGKVLRWIFTRFSKRRLPIINGELNLPGLINRVEVIRDKWGIPHIYSENDHDLFFAQGFIEAQDRLWQMEINRRTANGTLSELFGDLALETDISSRTFGFARLGKIDWENLDEKVKPTIQAYSDGVNAFLNHPTSKLPFEFSLIRYKPKLWKPEDSLAFSRVMLWKLSHAWYGEIVKAKIIAKVGETKAAELDYTYQNENPNTMPHGIEFNLLNKDGTLRKATGPFLSRSQGSNSWVISSTKSESNHAYLCNDMHLELMLPSIWYETHLVSQNFNVSGVTLVGVPMILVGHNNNIAWGSTLAFTDAEDLFIEQFNPDNPQQYKFKANWLEVEEIVEKIIVKGKPEPHIEKVLITQHGPIISDVVGYTNERIAVNSMALRPSKAMDGYWLLNQAKSWDEFVEAMRHIDATQLNMTYADVHDNIGYWVTGKVPIRAEGNDGSIPVPGWTGLHEWIGEVPFEEMPHAFNPQDGYLVTCNHKIVPDDYPHHLGNVWMNGYRARRFEEMIKGKTKLSIQDFKAMHIDYKNLAARDVINKIKNIKSNDPDIELAFNLLNEWDFNLTADSISGTVYEVFRYFIVKNILEKGIGKELTLSIMGKGFNPVLYHANEFYGNDTVIMLRLLDNPNSWWIQQAGGIEELITRNLKATINWLRKNLGKQQNNWQWGKLHRVNFNHAMGLQKPLDKVFNRGNIPIGGDTDTLCQTAFQAEDPYTVKAWAPSHRQIIDMNNFSNSLMIFAPGQSGHLGSKHYDDLIELWHKGEYHPMLWKKEEIEANSEGKLELNPT
ncbi:MAG: penicillin acylase family protein [Candidatus Hodarchaeales archaeon]